MGQRQFPRRTEVFPLVLHVISFWRWAVGVRMSFQVQYFLSSMCSCTRLFMHRMLFVFLVLSPQNTFVSANPTRSRIFILGLYFSL